MPDLHPILQAQNLSPQQWRAIDDLHDDALITAGAGTGKTRTLTARYLQLLTEGAPLRSIVAITFTRKAAREMRNRIRKEVWDFIGREEISKVERERWRTIAIGLDAARISTIHGLCQEILRTHPVEAGVDPDFQTLDESKSALLKEESIDEALGWAANQIDLAELLSTTPEKNVRTAVKTLLGSGADIRETLARLPDAPQQLLDMWEARLAAMQLEMLSASMADPAWQAACRFIESVTPLDPADGLAQQHAVAREALLLLENASSDGRFREGVRMLTSLDFSRGSQRAWAGGKDEKNAVKEALRQLRAPFKRDQKIAGSGRYAWLGKTLNAADERSARALAQLKKIALEALRIFEARKAELQALDFDDLEERAVRLLETHAEVRSWWQSQISALLVDEFQDTNARQTRLLAMLDGGRGVRFLVGDGKQSIYRFRGAEVAVFQRLRKEFQDQGKRVAPLDETWRAHRDLVHGLNTLLEPILGDAKRLWEVPFEPLHPARPQGPDCPEPPYIEFHLAAGSKSDGALKRSAQAVALRLRELLDEGRCTAGDVAILTQASTSFAAYEDALDAAGVPFITLAGRGFYQRPEIRDLMAVMRAAADPTDDIALAGALRSPGLGLSDAALYQLAQTQARLRTDRAAYRPSLWDALSANPEAVGKAEALRGERALQLIRRLHAKAGRAPVADVLKHFLDETDYLAILIAAGQERAARNISKLLEEVQRAGFVQINEFIEFVKLVRTAAVREGEAPVVTEGAVQIMSVHRAKGLEFPIVVLGDVTYLGRGDNKLIFADDWLAWKLPAMQGEDIQSTFHEALSKQEAARDEAESKRLLYVAATRAKELLLISGVAAKKGWLAWLADAAGLEERCFDQHQSESQQWDGVLPGGETPFRCALLAPDWTFEPQATARDSEQRTPRFVPAMLSAIDAREESLDEKLEAAEEKPERRVWRILPPEDRQAIAPAWVVGTLVHRAIELERFPDNPLFEDWLRASARGLGLSNDQMVANAVARSRRMLKRLQFSSIWQEIGDADQRIHEAPYDYLLPDGSVERGAIDLIWRKGERWSLIDFKTDRAEDRAAVQARIAEKKYDEQARRYIRAMEAILGQTPRAMLCFLNVDAARKQVVVIEISEG